MAVARHRPSILSHRSALGFVFALFLLAAVDDGGADDSSSWNEHVGSGSGGGTNGSSPLPPSTSQALPDAKPSVAATPRPKPTARPTPDPKKLSKDDFACRMVKSTADDMNAAIEKKRAEGGPMTSPAEKEYDDAYKDAVDELKKAKPNATQAELDAAGKKAGRAAVEKAIGDGKITTDTGESFGDAFRRQSEGANRGKPVPAPSNAVPANASDYMKQCAKDGVPLPPKWGDPAWVKQGDLPDGKSTALGEGNFPFVEAWVSKSPQGVCFAAPRRNEKGGEIQILDQICQGNNGKACFWDNSSPADGDTPVKVVDGLDPANLAGGDKLKRNCTECHRGDNAFIIRPSTALQLGPTNPCDKKDPGSRFGPTDPAKRLDPVGRGPRPQEKNPNNRPGFENPPDLMALGDGPCSACHSIPKLTYNYCTFVLMPMLINKEMPPKTQPPQNPANFTKDTKTLTDACKKIDDEQAKQFESQPSEDDKKPNSNADFGL